MPDADDHNIRPAFVAASVGLGKPTLILQNVSGPFLADANRYPNPVGNSQNAI